MSTNDMTKECIEEIRAFKNGGAVGLARLKQVMKSIFKHYQIEKPHQKDLVLQQAGIFLKGHCMFDVFDD
jgi:hypothetical protein